MSQYLTLYSNNRFASGDFAGLPRTYLSETNGSQYCGDFANFPAISQDPQCLDPLNNTNALSSTFQIKERFSEGYGKANFETLLGSMKLSGNIGLRYVHRDLTSIGNLIAASGAATPTAYTRHDNEWLPSFVSKLDVDDNLVVRFGAAKVVAFPNTADLNNGVTLFNNAVFVNGAQTALGTGNGGAPGLDPFKATQIDLAGEYYFGQQALVSVGLFYKDVSTFIVQEQSPETYNGVNYLINRKVNGDGAKVKGVETLVQLPFYFLPQPLDGFGAMATYSYIDSTTPIKDAVSRTLPFPACRKITSTWSATSRKGPSGRASPTIGDRPIWSASRGRRRAFTMTRILIFRRRCITTSHAMFRSTWKPTTSSTRSSARMMARKKACAPTCSSAASMRPASVRSSDRRK